MVAVVAGIPSGLSELQVTYGHFTTAEHEVRGATTSFSRDAPWVSDKPKVRWTLNRNKEKKYTLLMLDPDAPEPSTQGDGNKVGLLGPWMHWFVLNCKDSSGSGHEIYPYEAPNPPNAKPHRYIFVLFEQKKPGQLQGFQGDRMKWDVKGFLKANREALEPVAANFMYVTGKPWYTGGSEHDEL